MSANELDDSELEEFRIESTEMLDSGEEGLLAIDRGEDFLENYNSIFRVFHSLKGAAGMLGLEDLQSHMHQLETNLVICKERNGITKGEASYFLSGVDAARTILGGEPVDFDHATFSGEADAPAPAPAEEPPSAEPKTDDEKVKEDRNERETALKEKSRQNGLIYVVDDEEEVVSILSEIIIEAGFSFKGFSDAQSLLDEVKNVRPDVILTDMNMPNMNGYELLRAVQKFDRDIPVIFVSAHISKKLLIESIDHGIFGAIEKPFSKNSIISYCHNAVRKYKLTRLLNQSINFIMYQFADLESFLASQGKTDIQRVMKEELQQLLDQRRQLRRLYSE